MFLKLTGLALGLAALLSSTAEAAELLKQHVARPFDAEATMEALQAWETPIDGFFVRSHFDTPATDESQWTVVIDGLVEHPLRLTLADLKRRTATSLHAVLECSGNGRGQQLPHVPGVQWVRGAVGNAGWTGVSLKDLLAEAGVKPNAKFVTVSGADKPAKPDMPGYIRSIPLDRAQRDGTLLAYGMNGVSLPLMHGGPVRLVLPDWYGENWVKWVIHLTVTDAEDQGFFMKKAYRMPRQPVKPGEAWDSSTGVPVEELLVQSLIVSPVEGETVARGELMVNGKAFSGAGAITKVEVSIDGGGSWSAATLGPRHPDGGWQVFFASFAVPRAGPVTILSRATDSAGRVQPPEHTWNPSGYLRNSVDRVTVVVGDAATLSGAAVLDERCTTCHGRDMIESQRLTPAQWSATVEKMKKAYGATLSGPEQTALLAYVTRYAPDVPTTRPQPVTYGAVTAGYGHFGTSGADGKHGAKIFEAQCASCHGADGAGVIGPRIRQRAIGTQAFRTTVLYGRRTMPAFAALLKEADLRDLEAFLQR